MNQNLIGKLQECDCCHHEFIFWALKLDQGGKEFYCEKCGKEIEYKKV